MPKIKLYDNNGEFRRMIEDPARTAYVLGRADAYARSAGDDVVSHLIRKITKCIVADKGGVITNRLLQDLADGGA